MRGHCQVCRHANVAEIDAELARGKPHRQVAKKWGAQDDAVWRHGRHHIPVELKRAMRVRHLRPGGGDLEALRREEGEGLLVNLSRQRAVLLASQDRAVMSEQYGVVAQLSAQIHGNLSLVARLLGEFTKGDLIAKIDDRQVQLEINSTKSDFLNALANVLPEIKIDFPNEYEKWQNYFSKVNFDEPLPSLPKADNEKVKLFLSRYNVYKLYYSVQNLEIRHEKHFFYAPFDGSIVSTALRVGSTVRNGAQLGKILNMEDLEIEVSLPVKDIQWLDQSELVTFTSSELTGKWEGKIKRISDKIEDNTQTINAYISLNGSETSNLLDGVFLKADIPGKNVDNAIRLPRKAIYKGNKVFVINNGKLEERKVNIIRKEMNHSIINDGISKNDTVVVELMQGVSPGMPAKPILN